jgi:methionyl-tRNA synthetase
MLNRYRGGVVPGRSDELALEVQSRVQQIKTNLEQHELQAALINIWLIVNRANQYVDHTAPFKLAKDPTKTVRLDEVLYNLVEVCRILAVLLWPFIPGTAARIYSQVGLSGQPDRFASTTWGGLAQGHSISDIAPLFPKKDPA